MARSNSQNSAQKSDAAKAAHPKLSKLSPEARADTFSSSAQSDTSATTRARVVSDSPATDSSDLGSIGVEARTRTLPNAKPSRARASVPSRRAKSSRTRSSRRSGAVRHKSSIGQSRRPSAHRKVDRPSAAGQRRSHRYPEEEAHLGGAAAELDEKARLESSDKRDDKRELVVSSSDSASSPSSSPEPPSSPEAPLAFSVSSDSVSSEKPASDADAKHGVDPATIDAAYEATFEPPRHLERSKKDLEPSLHTILEIPLFTQDETEDKDELDESYEKDGLSKVNERHGSADVDADANADVDGFSDDAYDPESERLLDTQLKAEWHTDDDSNPYLADGVEGPTEDDWFEDEPVVAALPVRDIAPHRHKTPKKKRRHALLALLGVFFAIGALGLFVWFTRTIEFTVNGEDANAPYGTSLADFVAKHDFDFTPGNLVSVGGAVLAEGDGDAYAATVNGKPYTPSEAADYHLVGSEKIELGNGLDVLEPYDTETVEAPPKLEFEGSVGSVSFVSQWGKVGTEELRYGKLSGEVAHGDYLKEPVNTVVTTLNVVPEGNRKLVALTFDDGPSRYTPRYLKILKSHGVKATFFMFGPEAQQNPEMARQVVEAGHQVCNHTSKHQDLSALSAEALQSELSTTFSQVDSAADIETTTFRPPWTIFGQQDWLKSGGVASMSVIYNTDSRDWDQPGVDAIVESALEGVASGSIILMHDGGYALEQDLEALPIIIETLQNQGFEFVTVQELLASDPNVSAAAASCDDPRPEDSPWPTEILQPETESNETS